MNDNIIYWMEEHGVYQPYKVKGNVLTYYSYFGREGFYRVKVDCKTNKQLERKHLRYHKVPKFLITDNGTLYNYYVG